MVKWGIGPQDRLPTRTKSEFRGGDGGAGIAANHRSFDGGFETGMLQPMLFYDFESVSGAYVATMSVVWTADSGAQWTVPPGLAIGRTFVLVGGRGLDLTIGPITT
jgi:hypothetical protein